MTTDPEATWQHELWLQSQLTPLGQVAELQAETQALRAALRRATVDLDYAEQHIEGYELLRHRLRVLVDWIEDLLDGDPLQQAAARRFFVREQEKENGDHDG